MSWHLAESKKQAEKEAKHGLQRWHNEYNVDVLGRPGAARVEDADELLAPDGGARRRPAPARRSSARPTSW